MKFNYTSLTNIQTEIKRTIGLEKIDDSPKRLINRRPIKSTFLSPDSVGIRNHVRHHLLR